MTARDFFETVRACAGRLDGMHRELRGLTQARDECLPWQAKGSALFASMGGSHSDPTATEAQSRITGLDGQIATLSAQVDECERIVGEGLRALDAMRRALGERHADAMELYYVDGAGTWSEVAWEMGVSRRTVCRLRDEAFLWFTCKCPRYDKM